MSRLRSFLFLCFLVSVFACTKSDPSTEDFYKAILTNNISNLKNYLDGHDPEKFVLLPIRMILEKDVSGISDPILLEYLECKKLNYYLNNKNALEHLEDLLPKITASDYELLKFEANVFKQLISVDGSDENSFESFYKPYELGTIYGTYQYLKYLEFLGRIQRNKVKTYKALAIIDYALHVIEQSEYKAVFKNNQAILLQHKASLLLNESQDYEKHKTISADLLDKSITLLQSSGASIDDLFEVKVRKVNALLWTSSDSVLNPMIRELDSLLSHVDPGNQNWFYKNIGIHYFQNGQVNKAISLWNRNKRLIQNETCDKNYLYNLLYLIHGHSAIENIDSMEYYYSTMLELRTCGDDMISEIDFYGADVIKLIQEKKYSILDVDIEVDRFINPLLKKREAALILFTNEQEYHLGDFYAENLSQILDILIKRFKDQPIPEHFATLILNLLADTKSRELKRNLKQEAKTDDQIVLDEIDIQIQKCLYKIDDFKVCDDYKNPVYSELFNLYQHKGKLEEILPEINSDTARIDIKKVYNELVEREQVYVEYFLYGDMYYVIFSDGTHSRLHSFSKENFDSRLESHRTVILNKESDLELVGKMRRTLFPHALDSLDIVINPDGNISFVPFKEMFAEKNITLHYDLKTYLEQESLYFKKSTVGILSYTDDLTISDRSIKEYPELAGGFRESVIINALFKDSKLYSGAHCSKENIAAAFKHSILHISTHGFVNSDRRQDCYLLLRDRVGIYKLHPTDIISIGHVPDVVFLSACDSGLGRFMSAEGLFSLSRSFFQAGSKTVIKTLWKINDQITEVFTKHFYTEWNKGISAQQALYNAQAVMRASEYKDSYYWAGFVLEGNGEVYISK